MTCQDNRAQTLQALESFVQTQRLLLAHQRSDIEKLQKLKADLVHRPSQILGNLSDELDDPAFRLSEQGDCKLNLPKELDWSAFDKADTGPLRTFAQKTRDDIVQRSLPFPAQQSNLSDLQALVKRARRTIIDPIFLRFQRVSTPEPSSEEELDPIEVKRELERQKIRELKKRQIRSGGLSLPLSSRAGAMGVFIRTDVEEEAMDADVMIDDDDDDGGGGQDALMDPDVDATSPAPPAPNHPYATKNIGLLLAQTKSAASSNEDEEEDLKQSDELMPDTPNPRKKAKASSSNSRSKSKAKTKSKTKLKTKPQLLSEDDDSDFGASNVNLDVDDEIPYTIDDNADSGDIPMLTTETKKTRGPAKPKPETYKQAWSVSEQNLLEQLLEEVPEGEKFRWQKISRAMGGRRTPRQVASRVQKYFEKLKKFSLM